MSHALLSNRHALATPAWLLAGLPGRPTTPQLEEDEFTDEDDFDMPLLQRDPLRYFLTPATPEGDDDFEFQFDFDAGIDDVTKPKEIIRSVSPSTLDGLKSYKPKGKNNNTTTTNHDCAILDSDSDDDEEYIRFRPSKSLPLGLPDLGIERPRSAGASPSSSSESMLSPDSFHVGSLRGRPSKRFAPPPSRRTFGHSRSRSVPLPRRHSWREPGSDVWSIEEEPEKETLSERGLSTEDLEAYFHENKTAPMQIPTTAGGKPIKKVRFVLPGRDSYH